MILKRIILITGGTFFLCLGVVGIFLPLLPTTPFLLLSASLYAISSKRLHGWLLNNKLFGNYIKNYKEGKGIPLKVKILSLSFLWITILYSTFCVVKTLLGKIILLLIAIGVSIHIVSLKTLKKKGGNQKYYV